LEILEGESGKLEKTYKKGVESRADWVKGKALRSEERLKSGFRRGGVTRAEDGLGGSVAAKGS